MHYKKINLSMDQILEIVIKRVVEIGYVDDVVSIKENLVAGKLEYIMLSNAYFNGKYYIKQSILSYDDIFDLVSETYELDGYYVGKIDFDIKDDIIGYNFYLIETLSRKLKRT